MKSILTIQLILFSFFKTGFSQAPDIEWQKCLGGSGLQDEGHAILQIPDGGYIVAGSRSSNDGDLIDCSELGGFWVVKLDILGAIEWSRCFGGSGGDVAYSIDISIDGGYIICGYSASDDGDVTGNHGNFDCWIIKIDSEGLMEWQKSFGGVEFDSARSIKQTIDGGYIFIGDSRSNDGDVSGHHGSSSTTDYWVVKLNSAGDIEWEKSLGGSNDDVGFDVIETQDGGFLAAGYSFSFNGDVSINFGVTDYWIVKLNNSGEIDLEKSFGGTSTDIAQSVIQNDVGDFIIGGVTFSDDIDVTDSHGGEEFWILSLNTDGVINWKKCYGGSGADAAASINQTIDGGYILTGYTLSEDGDVTGHHGNGDYWVLKIDSMGRYSMAEMFRGN